MNRVFRIGLVYINTNNIGDIVIFDSTKYLIERSLSEMGVDDYEITPIDMGEKVANKSKLSQSFVDSQKANYSRANRYVKEWKASKLYSYFLKNEVPKLEYMDLIVFAGGGLIKFHQQNFHMYIDEITSVADRYGIPVVLNAVGIEGYKDNDVRCKILKNALNRSCVKAISTRDDLKLLREKYVVGRRIKTSLVCDPALWSAETYDVEPSKGNTVGIGVIRPEIFSLYGKAASKDALLVLYKTIINELESRKIKFKLFTNGARRDQEFIYDIKNYMQRDDGFDSLIEPIPDDGRELVERISRYGRILTCRMHAAVIAYSLGVPAVSVVWNRKLQYFAEITGQSDNLIFSRDFSKKDLIIGKILGSSLPDKDDRYKDSDRLFIAAMLRKYFRRRYLVKAKRFFFAFVGRISSKLRKV